MEISLDRIRAFDKALERAARDEADKQLLQVKRSVDLIVFLTVLAGISSIVINLAQAVR